MLSGFLVQPSNTLLVIKQLCSFCGVLLYTSTIILTAKCYRSKSISLGHIEWDYGSIVLVSSEIVLLPHSVMEFLWFAPTPQKEKHCFCFCFQILSPAIGNRNIVISMYAFNRCIVEEVFLSIFSFAAIIYFVFGDSCNSTKSLSEKVFFARRPHMYFLLVGVLVKLMT